MAGLIPFGRNNSLFSTSADDLYSVLDDFFGDAWMPRRGRVERGSFKVDVRDNGQEYVIEADLPGVAKDEVSLEQNDGRLTIAVNRQEETQNEAGGYIHRERRVSSMSRVIALGDADPGGVKAKLDNGVLTITVQKQAKVAASNKIDIE